MEIIGLDRFEDLEVGMRVSITANNFMLKCKNELGTIIKVSFIPEDNIINEKFVYIKFDNLIENGWDCDGLCEYGYGRMILLFSSNIIITCINNTDIISF